MNLPSKIADDPGRTHVCILLPRFIGMDLRLAKRRLWRRLGITQLEALLPDSCRIPDSALAKQATELVRELSDDVVLNHCLRSYAFGCVLGCQDRLKFDRELFYLACVMHDLGLTDRYAGEPQSFEYVGAKVAHEFCLDRSLEPHKAALVHDAIALHAAVGIAHKREPEVALVHYGAGLDVIGIRLDEIPKHALTEVLSQYPRLDFKRVFGDLLLRQAEKKPKSHISGHVGLGFRRKMEATSFSS